MHKELMRLGTKDIIPNLDKLNHNDVFYNILKLQRFDLLESNDINLHLIIGDSVSEDIVYELLNDEDNIYYLRNSGYKFSDFNKDIIINIFFNKFKDRDMFLSNLIYGFFNTPELVDSFVDSYSKELVNIIVNSFNFYSYQLLGNDKFVRLLLLNKSVKNIRDIQRYSVDNLKLLVKVCRDGVTLKNHLFNFSLMDRIFSDISLFTADEFCYLLDMFRDSNQYIYNDRTKIMNSFDFVVGSNMDELFDKVSEIGKVPFPLLTSSLFRDECIKRDRMDLAIQCIMDESLVDDDELVSKYSKELGISEEEFLNNFKWLLKYYKKNNKVFDLCLASMMGKWFKLLPEIHFERMINDIEFQTKLLSLPDYTLEVLTSLISMLSYDLYDGAFVITNIVNNITNYASLIKSINLEREPFTVREYKLMIQLLQDDSNYYGIVNRNQLPNITRIKNAKYKFGVSHDIEIMRETILRYLFSLNVEEAKRINEKYCYDNHGLMLDKLSMSELPEHIFNRLYVLNRVVESNDINELNQIHEYYKGKTLNNDHLPFEVALRSVYAKLYDKALYSPMSTKKRYDRFRVKYNGDEIAITIPKEEFGLLVHCVGSCSLEKDIISSNYCEDWVERPQMTDHYLACSYITDKKFLTVRSKNSVIYGFGDLNYGALYGMGNTDIDSIGPYSSSYSGSIELMDQGSRAHFFPPSLLISTSLGYNEVVIERRCREASIDGEFKRCPKYIVGMIDSLMFDRSITSLDEYLDKELRFISRSDRESLKTLNERESLKLLSSYKEEFKKINSDNPKRAALDCIDKINMYKSYEDALKAASEFGISIVLIDRTLHFGRLLESSNYDRYQKEELYNLYVSMNFNDRSKLIDNVSLGVSYDKIVGSPEENRGVTIPLYM